MSDEPHIGGVKNVIVNAGASPGYAGARGAFGTMASRTLSNGRTLPYVSWWTCREQFHTFCNNHKTTEFYYRVDDNCGPDTAHFILRIEKHLGLQYKSRFQYTDRANVIWCQPERWWLINPMRFQFFSICLRASLNWRRHENKDLRYILNLYAYAAETPAAVDRFLAGYTWYTGSVVGWKKQFTGTHTSPPTPITPQALKRLLVLPDYERERRIKEAAYFKWMAAGQPEGASFYDEAAREHDAREAA